MPPIDLVTDFMSSFSSMSPQKCTSWPWRTIMPLPGPIGLCRDRCCPAEWSCAKFAASSRPCLRHADGGGLDLGPTVERPFRSSSSAGHTSATGGAALTVTATVSEPLSVPSLTVSVSVYAPAVVNVASLAAAVAAENVTPAAGSATPLISQRRGRTIVRRRARQRHRRVRQRRRCVGASTDRRRSIRRRRCAGGGVLLPPPPPPPHAARTNSALTRRTHLIPRMEKFPLSEERRHPAR